MVRPRGVYGDGNRPALVESFTRDTFIAMVDGVREDALATGLTSRADWDRGPAELERTHAVSPGRPEGTAELSVRPTQTNR